MADNDNGIPVVRDDDGRDINFGLRLTAGVCGLVVFIIAGGIFASGNGAAAVFTVLVFSIGGGLVFKVFADDNIANEYARRRARDDERDRIIKELHEMEKQNTAAITELQARQAGDIIIAGDNTTC